MSETYIIAEVAQGYEGRSEYVNMYINAAAATGADAVKFQLVYAEELSVPGYKYHELFSSLELADHIWKEAALRAKEKNIDLILDIFGPRSLCLAEELDISAVKIHSTDISNIGLLQQVSQSRVTEVLLSCEGCMRDEIERAIEIMREKYPVLLFGFQGYPTSNEANQIARIHEYVSRYGELMSIGFADHSPIDSDIRFLISAASLGAGATVLEKHITISSVMKMEDYESALNPDEFSIFVKNLRQVAENIGSKNTGDADFGMHDSEKQYRASVRKHVVAAHDLPDGHT